MPGGIYHSIAFLDLEIERLFDQGWICVGREDDIPHDGDFITHHIINTPVVVFRQSDGSVRAFVNACAHRFTKLLEGRGSNKRFSCPYHGWTYCHDGALLHAPHMEQTAGFDPKTVHLRHLHCEVWQGFIFVTLNERPNPLRQQLQKFEEDIVLNYAPSRYVGLFRDSMTWRANWKQLVENGIENYHVPQVHRSTFAMNSTEDEVCIPGGDAYTYNYGDLPEGSELGVAHQKDDTITGIWRRRSVVACVFPCQNILFAPDMLWYISVQPRGTDQLEALWGVSVPPQFLEGSPQHTNGDYIKRIRTFIDMANMEDKSAVHALWQASRASVLPKGRLASSEVCLWAFARYLARELCTDEPIAHTVK